MPSYSLKPLSSKSLTTVFVETEGPSSVFFFTRLHCHTVHLFLPRDTLSSLVASVIAYSPELPVTLWLSLSLLILCPDFKMAVLLWGLPPNFSPSALLVLNRAHSWSSHTRCVLLSHTSPQPHSSCTWISYSAAHLHLDIPQIQYAFCVSPVRFIDFLPRHYHHCHISYFDYL